MNRTIIKFLLISVALNLLKKPDEKKLAIPSFKGILEVKHAIPGRIRFYAPIIKYNEELKNIVQCQLEKVKAIDNIEVNVITGSILVVYDTAVIDTPLLIGIIIKLLNLEGEMYKEPVSIVKREMKNVKDSLNLAIYDKSNGIIDGKSLIVVFFMALGIYAIRNKSSNIAGLNYLWWAYTGIDK